MSVPFSSTVSSEQLDTIAPLDTGTSAVLDEQRAAEERVLVEGNEQRPVDTMDRFAFGVARQSTLCPRCDKTQHVGVVKIGRSYRDEYATPVGHCACTDGGVVLNADAWAVVLIRQSPRDRAEVRLRDPRQSMDFFTPVRMEGAAPAAFEWGDDSPGARELAIAILNLVVGVKRAVALADAFVAEEISQIHRVFAPRQVNVVTVRQVRSWVASHEATSGAAA